MARKLSKSDTERLATDLSRKNGIARMGEEQIRALGDYSERRKVAMEQARLALEANLDKVHYTAAFLDYYESGLLNAWGVTLKQVENARKNFRDLAVRAITYEEYIEKLAQFVKVIAPRAYVSRTSITLSADTWHDRGRVEVNYDYDFENRVVDPDNKDRAIRRYDLRVTVGWSSSSSRSSLAEGIKHQNDVAEIMRIAAEVEVWTAQWKVVAFYGDFSDMLRPSKSPGTHFITARLAEFAAQEAAPTPA